MVNRKASALNLKRQRLQERADAVPYACGACGEIGFGRYCYWCRQAEKRLIAYMNEHPLDPVREGGPKNFRCCDRFSRWSDNPWGWNTTPFCNRCQDTLERSIRRKLRRAEQVEVSIINRKKREKEWRKKARETYKQVRALVQSQKRAASN